MATKSIKVLVYPAQDLDKAKTFYNAFFGVEPYADTPYYVGYRIGELEVGLDPNGAAGPIAYTDVEDIRAGRQEMIDVGAQLVQDVTDVANGLLIALVKDPNGNVVGLRQQP